jgi:hypothetical protein
VLLFSWLPLAFLLSTFYRTLLLATLTKAEYEPPMDTSEQILASGLPLLVQRPSVMDDTFRSSPIPTVRRLFQVSILN